MTIFPLTKTPIIIPGCSLWLDGNDPAGNVGTNNYTPIADGAALQNWIDKSGNGNSAMQGLSIYQPIFKTGILSGKSIIRFDAINPNIMAFNSAFLNGSSYSIFAVNIRRPKDTNYFLGTGSGSADTSLHYGYRTDTIFTLAQFSNDLDVVIPSYIAPTPSLSSGILNLATGHSLNYYVNGILYSGSNANVTPLSSSESGRLGAGYEGGGHFYSGDIAEIIIYNRALSISERQLIERYLANKWGVAI